MKTQLVGLIALSLVQGILAAPVSESTIAEAVCKGGWKFIETAHVEGGGARPSSFLTDGGIADEDGCKAECIRTPDCIAIDWNFNDVPYNGARCWIHTSTYESMQLRQNKRVNHFIMCDDDNAACNDAARPQVLRASSGIISSPIDEDSGVYPNNAACDWLIQVPAGKVISIHFTRFHLEGEAWELYDTIEVYDGVSSLSLSLLGAYSGDVAPPDMTSSGNSVFIRFNTDPGVGYSGFELTYSTGNY